MGDRRQLRDAEGIALIAIVTAAVTSTFVERARAAREQAEHVEEHDEQARIDARFDELSARLERMEATLNSLTKA
jgi:hypothetical protein